MKAPEGLHVERLHPDRGLPLVISPRGGEDLLGLLRTERGWLEEQLLSAGALLLRGFGVQRVEQFDEVTAALSSSRPSFSEESSPRSRILGAVYTSTDYPPEYPIQFHNEYSYSARWPLRLFFCCLVPPATGGATPVADTRRVLQRLGAQTRARFEEKGVLYIRHFTPNLGVSWQKAFNTEDPATIERHCREAGIELRWGPGGRLRTQQRGPAIAKHPTTGEEVWFNHGLFFNVRGIEPEALREFFLGEPEDSLSTNTSYGDGSPIEPEVIEEVRRAYHAESSRAPWQQGDILVVDNMLASHAREAFSGPRKVAVVMADPHGRAVG